MKTQKTYQNQSINQILASSETYLIDNTRKIYNPILSVFIQVIDNTTVLVIPRWSIEFKMILSKQATKKLDLLLAGNSLLQF